MRASSRASTGERARTMTGTSIRPARRAAARRRWPATTVPSGVTSSGWRIPPCAAWAAIEAASSSMPVGSSSPRGFSGFGRRFAQWPACRLERDLAVAWAQQAIRSWRRRCMTTPIGVRATSRRQRGRCRGPRRSAPALARAGWRPAAQRTRGAAGAPTKRQRSPGVHRGTARAARPARCPALVTAHAPQNAARRTSAPIRPIAATDRRAWTARDRHTRPA